MPGGARLHARRIVPRRHVNPRPKAMRVFVSTIRFLVDRFDRFLLPSALAVALAVAAQAAPSRVVFHDDFNGQAIGAAPAGWTTPHTWRVRAQGGVTLLSMEDSGSWNGQQHDRRITKLLPESLTRSWVLDFDHAWRWGGDTTSKRGYHSLRIDVWMVNAAGHGYCLRIPQGSHGLSGADPGERLFQLFRVTSGQLGAAPLAQGRGYDSPGWLSLGLSSPSLRSVRLSWDRLNRRLVAYRKTSGDWEAVIDVKDAAHAGFDRLIINPSNFNNSVGPQIDNVLLRAPRELKWGVAGHADSGVAYPVYRSIGAAATLDRVKALGLEWYRVDSVEVADEPTGAAFFDSVVKAAEDRGVSVLPILFGTRQNTTAFTLEQLYQVNFAKAENFARFYRGRFTHVEVLNEMDNQAITHGNGDLVGHYDPEKLARHVAVFKGLCDGLRAGDPAVVRMIGAAGWYHYGYIDHLLAQGVPFEALVWHWYSDMGSVQRVMAKLAAYDLPIWVTEFNRRNGTYFGSALAENFSLHTWGQPPSAWTGSGAWSVDRHGTNQLVTNTNPADEGSGWALERATSTPVDLTKDWALDLQVGWRRGGVAGSGGHGDFSLRSEIDLVNAAGAGFRLRVRQGTSGNPDNAEQVMQLFRLAGAGGAETLVAQGSGANVAGWQTRGLSAPSLTRVRLKWAYDWDPSVRARRLTLRWGDGHGTVVFSIPYTEAWPTVDRVVLRARGTATGGAGAQFDSFQLYRDDPEAAEPAQARTLAAMAAEFSHFPQVEALFPYELFDEPNQQTDEQRYGLYRVRRSGSTYFADTPRLGAEAYAEYVAARGALPAEPGSIVVDNAFLAPAFLALGAWTEQSAADSWLGHHLVSADTASTSFARFSPAITVAGAHSVWARFPSAPADVTGVPVRVNTSSGLSSLSVTQPAGGGWVRIGEFNLRAGEASPAAAYVEFGPASSGATRVDAVRFQRKGIPSWSGEQVSNLAEPDVDGVSRLLKVATAMPLGSPLPYPVSSLDLAQGRMTLSFNRPVGGAFSYFVESSEDLSVWSPLAWRMAGAAAWSHAGAAITESGTGEARRVIVTDPVSAGSVPRRFLRLRVHH